MQSCVFAGKVFQPVGGIRMCPRRESFAHLPAAKNLTMYERARLETPRSIPSATVRDIECGSSELSALIERVAGGEQLALTELYELTVARLSGLARLLLRNSAD